MNSKEIKRLLFELDKLLNEVEEILEQNVDQIKDEKLLSEYINRFKNVFIKRNIEIDRIFNDILENYNNLDFYDLMEIIEWFIANIEFMNSKWAKFFHETFFIEEDK